jgi:acid phosphatase family membrane protein YuiD
MIEDFYRYKKLETKHLKELLGHTRFEVFFGILLGIAVAMLIVR